MPKEYIIVEDEQFAYKEMKRMMARLRPEFEMVAHTESVVDTVSFLRRRTVDLILLDIRLADGMCFEIFEQLKISTPVIFTTAYDEHAIKAFKVNSIDYLLKPIEEDDLSVALKKFESLHQENSKPVDYQQLEKMLMGHQKKNRFLVQIGDNYQHIAVDDIAYFYSEDKVVYLQTFQANKYIIDYSLTELESKMDEGRFFRVSRNCIANINAVIKIAKYFNSRMKLTLEPMCPQEILVSRERVRDFLNWVDGIN
jgi:DNA-binding LytR/AlgR family response regulator